MSVVSDDQGLYQVQVDGAVMIDIDHSVEIKPELVDVPVDV